MIQLITHSVTISHFVMFFQLWAQTFRWRVGEYVSSENTVNKMKNFVLCQQCNWATLIFFNDCSGLVISWNPNDKCPLPVAIRIECNTLHYSLFINSLALVILYRTNKQTNEQIPKTNKHHHHHHYHNEALFNKLVIKCYFIRN